jgi:hypothetical protein
MAYVAIGMSRRIAMSIGSRRTLPVAVTGSDPKHPFDPANSAADHSADDPSDRARGVVSDGRAVGGTFGNPLRLRRKRRCECGDKGGC